MNIVNAFAFLLGLYIALCCFCYTETDAHSVGIHSDVIVTKFEAGKTDETVDSEEQPGWMVCNSINVVGTRSMVV